MSAGLQPLGAGDLRAARDDATVAAGRGPGYLLVAVSGAVIFRYRASLNEEEDR